MGVAKRVRLPALPPRPAGLLAGVDEAGRGPLAGPVIAAAVMLNPTRPIKGLADSKALSARRREQLYEEICDKALCVAWAEGSPQQIDQLNILGATLAAMAAAVARLRLTPTQVWVDGNRPPTLPLPCLTIVKGDARVAEISAASIIAKVQRDRLCAQLHERFPQYGFDVHKGYPTPAHLAALRAHGPCSEHRMSFAPVRAAQRHR